MATIADETLQQIRERALGTREMTLDEAGGEYSIDDFAETVTELRKRMRTAIESLPDTAFTEQQAGEGEEVWAVGQVIAHLSNSLYSMSSQFLPLIGAEPLSAPEPYDLTQRPTREDAVTILERTNAVTDELFASIPRDADLSTRQQHPRFGEIGPKGWLSLMTFHEEGHLRQIEALRG